MPRSTKGEIQAALLELLEQKPLDEITVTELVERCGISRQAFYYHFSDLYGVVDWSLQQELEKLQDIQSDQWWTVMQQTMERLRNHRTVVLNIYRAYERSYVEHYLCRWLLPPIRAKVEETAKNHRVTPQQEQFVTQLCAQGLASVVLRWVDRGMPQKSVDWLEDFYAIMDGSMDFMLERLAQRRQKN